MTSPWLELNLQSQQEFFPLPSTGFEWDLKRKIHLISIGLSPKDIAAHNGKILTDPQMFYNTASNLRLKDTALSFIICFLRQLSRTENSTLCEV